MSDKFMELLRAATMLVLTALVFVLMYQGHNREERLQFLEMKVQKMEARPWTRN